MLKMAHSKECSEFISKSDEKVVKLEDKIEELERLKRQRDIDDRFGLRRLAQFVSRGSAPLAVAAVAAVAVPTFPIFVSSAMATTMVFVVLETVSTVTTHPTYTSTIEKHFKEIGEIAQQYKQISNKLNVYFGDIKHNIETFNKDDVRQGADKFTIAPQTIEELIDATKKLKLIIESNRQKVIEAQPAHPSGYFGASDGSRISVGKGNLEVNNAFDAATTLMPPTSADSPMISNTIDSKVTYSIRGIALLINNYSFAEKRDFSHTSDDSSAKLVDTLHKNGYDVTSYTNLSAMKMEEKIKQTCERVTDKHDGIIIGISSYGSEMSDGEQVHQVVYGTDDKPVDITDIILKFTSKEYPQLRGKVKTFLIDACRGENDCKAISAKKILDKLIKRSGAIVTKGDKCAKNIIILNTTQPGFRSNVGKKDPVLVFSYFADCLEIPEYRRMKPDEFLKIVKEAVEKAAKEQIGKKIEVDVQSDLDDNLEFSFGSPAISKVFPIGNFRFSSEDSLGAHLVQQPNNMTAIFGDLPNMPLYTIPSTYTHQPIPKYVTQPPYPSGCFAAYDESSIQAPKENLDVDIAHATTISKTNIKSEVNDSIRGCALLINNYEFDKLEKFGSNSVKSSEKLSKALIEIGYDVRSCTNLTKVKMIEEINKMCKNTEKTHDSVIIGITSHGCVNDESEQIVCGTDEEVNIAKLILNFTSKNSPQLKDKVKIFLIDACRGNKHCEPISAKKIYQQLKAQYADSVRSKGGECNEPNENIIIINATQSGFCSYECNEEDPVLLFSCFAECLRVPEYLCMEIRDFCEAVVEAGKKAAEERCKKKMIPEVQYHMLDPRLKFSFGKSKPLTHEDKAKAIDKASLAIAARIKSLHNKCMQQEDGFKALYSIGNGWDSPSSIDEIKPELYAYRNEMRLVKIPHNRSPTDAINELYKEGLLWGSERVIFITHGYIDNSKTDWLHSMKDTMLKHKDQTVIIIAWFRGAKLPIREYGQAALNIQSVGKWLADYAGEIKKRFPEMNIWGVGYSLGAHLVGIAGRISKAFTRITGLDPAGPSFEDGDNHNMRLRKDDALIVDVIHTNGYDSMWSVSRGDMSNEMENKGLIVNHYGTLIPLGTVDFYPNYGHSQPGCCGVNYLKLSKIGCSHERAIDLFIWSISNPGKFKTKLVLDGSPYLNNPVDKHKVHNLSAEMGYHYKADSRESPQKHRNYYIKTNAKEPWI